MLYLDSGTSFFISRPFPEKIRPLRQPLVYTNRLYLTSPSTDPPTAVRVLFYFLIGQASLLQ